MIALNLCTKKRRHDANVIATEPSNDQLKQRTAAENFATEVQPVQNQTFKVTEENHSNLHFLKTKDNTLDIVPGLSDDNDYLYVHNSSSESETSEKNTKIKKPEVVVNIDDDTKSCDSEVDGDVLKSIIVHSEGNKALIRTIVDVDNSRKQKKESEVSKSKFKNVNYSSEDTMPMEDDYQNEESSSIKSLKRKYNQCEEWVYNQNLIHNDQQQIVKKYKQQQELPYPQDIAQRKIYEAQYPWLSQGLPFSGNYLPEMPNNKNVANIEISQNMTAVDSNKIPYLEQRSAQQFTAWNTIMQNKKSKYDYLPTRAPLSPLQKQLLDKYVCIKKQLDQPTMPTAQDSVASVTTIINDYLESIKQRQRLHAYEQQHRQQIPVTMAADPEPIVPTNPKYEYVQNPIVSVPKQRRLTPAYMPQGTRQKPMDVDDDSGQETILKYNFSQNPIPSRAQQMSHTTNTQQQIIQTPLSVHEHFGMAANQNFGYFQDRKLPNPVHRQVAEAYAQQRNFQMPMTAYQNPPTASTNAQRTKGLRNYNK